VLTFTDLSDRGTKHFPGKRQVPVFGARNPNTLCGSSVDRSAIRQPLPDRLFEKLADNRHTFPIPTSVINEFTLSLSMAMLGRRDALQDPVKFRISPAVEETCVKDFRISAATDTGPLP